MEINRNISQQIVNELYSIIEYNINIMDINGVVIASTDLNRIDTIHQGALAVIKDKRTVYIREDEVDKDVKEGVNLPIEFRDSVIGVVGITGRCDKVAKYGVMVKKISEILVKENFDKEYKKSIQDMNSLVITNIIYSTDYNPNKIKQLAKHTGIYSDVQKYAMLINLNREDTMFDLHISNNRLMQKIALSSSHIDTKYFFSQTNEGIIIIAECDPKNQRRSVENIFKILDYTVDKDEMANIRIGISNIYTRFWDMDIAYKQAKIASEVGAFNNKRLTIYNDLDIDLVLQEVKIESKRLFEEKVIGNIVQNKQLVETLVTFFECNCSISDTSNKMYIHKNTLQYRLNKIKELTGYDPRTFTEAIRLYIALKLQGNIA